MRHHDGQHHDGQHEGVTCTGVCSVGPTRRRALTAGGALVATSTLAACGGGGSATDESGAQDTGADDAGGTEESEGGTESGGGDAVRLPLADTPVGGSTYYEAEEVIVSQPTEGEVVVFDATCTHQGCMVSGTGDDATLVCPCHNSVFASDSGEVVSGPATGPLATLTAEIDGGDVVISA